MSRRSAAVAVERRNVGAACVRRRGDVRVRRRERNCDRDDE